MTVEVKANLGLGLQASRPNLQSPTRRMVFFDLHPPYRSLDERISLTRMAFDTFPLVLLRMLEGGYHNATLSSFCIFCRVLVCQICYITEIGFGP